MKFSERMNIQEVRSLIQYEMVDVTTRNLLWNLMSKTLEKNRDHQYLSGSNKVFAVNLWNLYFKKTIDDIPFLYIEVYNEIKAYFFNCEWYEVYDFIEVFPELYFQNNYQREEYRKYCNIVLEQECCAYRFIDSHIVKLTDDMEIESIEKSLSLASKHIGAQTHIKTSLQLLSDKSNPDYRNSIKESILAVESTCKIIVGDNKATLGKALDILEKKYQLHTALKEGFKKIYGYTSDADGIRHALLEESTLKYDDAFYMLVSCSAFINYLISKVGS
jgi:hypothetical protein